MRTARLLWVGQTGPNLECDFCCRETQSSHDWGPTQRVGCTPRWLQLRKGSRSSLTWARPLEQVATPTAFFSWTTPNFLHMLQSKEMSHTNQQRKAPNVAPAANKECHRPIKTKVTRFHKIISSIKMSKPTCTDTDTQILGRKHAHTHTHSAATTTTTTS